MKRTIMFITVGHFFITAYIPAILPRLLLARATCGNKTKIVVQLTIFIILICSLSPRVMAAEESYHYDKALSNGGQLRIKSTTRHEFIFGDQGQIDDYSYVTPSGLTEHVGACWYEKSGASANPDVIFAGKLIFINLNCNTSNDEILYVRTAENGWRTYVFTKSEYDKYPLWINSKVRLDDKWHGGTDIIAIDTKKLTVAVEYRTYKTIKMTFRFSEDGEKIEMIDLERRFDPHQDPESLIAKLTDKSLSPNDRAIAAQRLGGMEEPKAVNALISALSDDGLHVRPVAIEALGRIGDKRAVPRLMAILEKVVEDKYTRRDAAKALGGIKDHGAAVRLGRSSR
ncbi:MAG: HEAT repeat domain-containing protein [Nitrospirae bacterium]|nr:HEAT repeat domain-containing protein [Nitrospirota bacterium]